MSQKKRLRRRTWIKTCAAAATWGTTGAVAASIGDAPREIGGELQLLLDDWLVAERKGLARTLHPPIKQGLIKEADGRDWERGDTYVGHIVCRDRQGRFHMTYRYEWWDASVVDAVGDDRAHWFRESIAYATSDDGIHWHKPKLGLVEGPTAIRKTEQFPFEAPAAISKENNLGCPIDFIYDLHAHGNVHDADKRFLLRLATRDDTHPFANVVESGLYFAADWPDFAGDPHWKDKLTPIPGGNLSPRARNDHKTLVGFDHQAGVWFSTHQDELGNWIERGGRDIARYTSPDFGEWQGPELVLPIAADESRQPRDWVEYMYLDGYRVGGPRSGAWLGQLTVFHSDRSDPRYQWPGGDGVWRKGLDDVRLMLSRDAGRSWQRVAGKRVWLGHGREPHAYDRLIYNTKEPVRVGDELWFYYPAYDGDHLIFNRDGSLFEPGFIRTTRTARATLRLDGYVSLDAGDSAGTLLTRPLRVTGQKLAVNLRAPEGALRAELLDAANRPLPGYALADCRPTSGDGVALTVRWRHGQRLGDVAAQPLRVRFELTRGELYSFQFVTSDG